MANEIISNNASFGFVGLSITCLLPGASQTKMANSIVPLVFPWVAILAKSLIKRIRVLQIWFKRQRVDEISILFSTMFISI